MPLLAFWLAAVSYSRDVAPILAMRCHGCHGEAGGLSTRSYASLLAGGNLGRLVVPGDPDASLLTHFLDGRRGAQRRMPIGGKPLSGREMALIRQWIAEGAREDHASMAIQSKHITGLVLPTGGALRISARVPGEGFVTVRVTDSASKVWFERLGAVKEEPEEADLGKPGDLLAWDVRSGTGWPDRVTVTLLVQYASDMQLELVCRMVRKSDLLESSGAAELCRLAIMDSKDAESPGPIPVFTDRRRRLDESASTARH